MDDKVTTKLYETEEIIVWEMHLKPGESTGIHTHHNDFLFYVVQGSTLEIKDQSNNLLLVDDVEPGRIMQFYTHDSKLIFVTDPTQTMPCTHLTKNIGKDVYKEILIELKKQKVH